MKSLCMRVSGISLTVLLFGALSACRGWPEPYPDRLPIGTVQGKVGPEDDGVRHESPLDGEVVTVGGVVHQVLRWHTPRGEARFGMMIQDTPAQADGDPLTSDGLFVYLSEVPALTMGTRSWSATVGDVVLIRGEVNERFGQTELNDVTLLKVLARNRTLNLFRWNSPRRKRKVTGCWSAMKGCASAWRRGRWPWPPDTTTTATGITRCWSLRPRIRF